MKLLIIIVFSALVINIAKSVSYERYKVYQVKPKSDDERQLLKKFENDKRFDFWNEVNKIDIPVSVMVSPEIEERFIAILKFLKIEHKVLIEDVEKTIQAERSYHLVKKSSFKKGRIAFDQYLQHDEMNAYLTQLSINYPDTVTLQTIGKSFEGREMNLIRISSGLKNGTQKPSIFIDGGIHAREWISPAVALYVINQLVENPTRGALLDNIDWIILPNVNPDGYQFTWTENRMWRKTVSKGTICDGVDANRNFAYHWMESGSDSWECSEIYAGPRALSEIEIRNLRNFLWDNRANIIAYINLHSYSQMILTPYAYAEVYPDNRKEIEDVGWQIAEAIKAVRGTKYDVGSPPSILYPAAGGTIDWAVAPEPEGAGIGLAYAIELPGGGIFGFDLPASKIQPVVEETFEGFKALHDYIVEKKL